MEQIKLLASRRAYEFRIDDIRLSMLCTKPIQEQIQQHFHFQSAVLGTPMSTFGEVHLTHPSGAVFDMGVWTTPDKQLIPIRFLHFDQYRIVIDIAGSSSTIDEIYEELRNFLSPLKSSDGSPILGQPERILDYSELTVKLSNDISTLLANPVRLVLNRYAQESTVYKNKTFLPILLTVPFGENENYTGTVAINDYRSFTLTVRAGTHLEDMVFFSGAPLTSHKHTEYLSDLAEELEHLSR